MDTRQIFIFIFLSLPILYISRASLRTPGSHGFFRFFAWEAILALVLLNLPHWFENPFGWRQLISWSLLFVSLYPLLEGVRLLRSRGKPDAQRDDAPMLAFEKTTQLVTTGLYGYIRHPLYCSLLLLTWGVFYKNPTWPAALLTAIAAAFLFLTARADETENLRYFGPAYQEYMQTTGRFIPIRPWPVRVLAYGLAGVTVLVILGVL